MTTPLEAMIYARSRRDVIRAAIMEEVRRMGDAAPKALVALLRADQLATVEFAGALTEYELSEAECLPVIVGEPLLRVAA